MHTSYPTSHPLSSSAPPHTQLPPPPAAAPPLAMKLYRTVLLLALVACTALARDQGSLRASIAAPGDDDAAAAKADAKADAPAATTEEDPSTLKEAEEKANAAATKALKALAGRLPGGHLSIAMRAVLMLVFLFFIVQTIIKVIQTKIEIGAASGLVSGSHHDEEGAPVGAYHAADDAPAHKKAYNMFVGFFSLQSMNAMVNTMNVVPMLCILMIFARLRASVDLHTAPQAYARGFFITSSLAIYIQALTAVVFPRSGKGCCYWVGQILDWVATLVLYLGVVCIIVSVCTLERCAEPEDTRIDQQFFCATGNKNLNAVVAAMPTKAQAAAAAKAGLFM